MRRTISMTLAALLLAGTVVIGGCASQAGYQGAAAGGLVGGVAGALLHPQNPWKGAVIGGALGGTFGGAMGEISHQNSYRRPTHNQGGYYYR